MKKYKEEMVITLFPRSPSAKYCVPPCPRRLSRRFKDSSICKSRMTAFYIINNRRIKITVLHCNITTKCCTFLPDNPTFERISVMIVYENQKPNMRGMQKESKSLCSFAIYQSAVVAVHFL
jgi:hypothetical protein